MGIGTGTRRAANRSNAKTKYVASSLTLPRDTFSSNHRASTDAGRSESPYVGSENGAASDDASPSPAKGKGKAKNKRAGG